MKSVGMIAWPLDAYSEWLQRGAPVMCLQETGRPPEMWMQQLWRHQRLRRDRLQALDGTHLRVLHPGFWNREPGPDFRRALIQLGEGPVRCGDVELDVDLAGWRGHRHDRNPAFAGVILRVVWEAVGAAELPGGPLILPLKPFLDAPLSELTAWLTLESRRTLPSNLPGRCAHPLRELPVARCVEILHQAARSRLVRKASEMGMRARHDGWEQVLWESLAGALGYKHNVWPMRRLAEMVRVGEAGLGGVGVQARLLGLSSFLGSGTPRVRLDPFVRSLWDWWWRERDAWQTRTLPESAWHMAGIRPANHPHRRLALLAAWHGFGGMMERLEAWIQTSSGPLDAALELMEVLQPVDVDPFWLTHWTLGSRRFEKPQPLLGQPRCTDLAMNVILPWLWVRAGMGRGDSMQARVEARYLSWPAGEDNAALRMARDRLMGGVMPGGFPRTAAVQQGLLQIVHDFCDQTDALCSGCEFPGLLRQWDRGVDRIGGGGKGGG